MFFKPKKIPRVSVGNIVYSYSSKGNCWVFSYEGISFTLYGELLVIPDVSSLNGYIDLVRKRFLEIKSRIEELKETWGDELNAKSAHISMISIENNYEFSASILGDETWGDLGYDMWFKNGVIVNEGFGD
jgi:hypothetical protein